MAKNITFQLKLLMISQGLVLHLKILKFEFTVILSVHEHKNQAKNAIFQLEELMMPPESGKKNNEER